MWVRPVRCSNDGCEETVDRQDLASHERESCDFRPVTCEECHERMNQKEYRKHPCVFRKELDENKRGMAELLKIMREMQEEQLRLRLDVEMHLLTQGFGQLNARQSRQGDDLRRQGSGVTQPNTRQRQQRNDSEVALISRNLIGAVGSLSSQVQRQTASRGWQFLVAGGGSRSHEVFNWSTQRWTLYENSLFFDHDDGFSFVYDNKIMICGGNCASRVECLDITNPRSAITFPLVLPSAWCNKGALCGDTILTFGGSVSATDLKAPYKIKEHICYAGERYHKFSAYGAACVSENRVVIVGGIYILRNRTSSRELTDDVRLYNPTTNQLEKLAPLPYKVSNMAVQVYNDNVIILGGTKEHGKITNDVFMYNITSQHCFKLPSMLEARSKCAAVIMGDTVIAIGGEVLNETSNVLSYSLVPRTKPLNTAEYLVLGEDRWKKLSPMHIERAGATACVLP